MVTVTDLNNTPSQNTTVNAKWSGVVSGAVSGKTGLDGTVSFTKATTKSGTATFTVTGITPPAGYTYDPSKNLKTCLSISIVR